MTTSAMLTLAQSSSSSSSSGSVIGSLFVLVIWLAVIIVCIAGLWKVFAKAGQPGWGAIIPIYNVYILCTIAGRPWWWLILFFIPIVGIIVAAIVSVDIAKAFGKSLLFGIGLWLLAPIFYCILGFGSAQYQGPRPASLTNLS